MEDLFVEPDSDCRIFLFDKFRLRGNIMMPNSLKR